MFLSYIPLLAGLVIACTQSNAQNPEFKEQIKREFTLSKSAENSTLAIYNIDGFIKVEGYAGDKIVLEVDKKISAKTEELVEQGKREFLLQFDQNADSLIAYIAEPNDSRPNRNWNRGDNYRRIDYRYHLDFTVKVPYGLNLAVSTVNGGDITVANVNGKMQATNVNGAIRLTNIKGATKLRTINGDVEANYLTAPPDQSSYYTLNGNIRITYPNNLSADCLFKTFHGEFYTDFSDVAVLPAQVTKNEEQKGDKTVYKLNKDSHIRIGRGGQTLRFETFNGNIYLKKQS